MTKAEPGVPWWCERRPACDLEVRLGGEVCSTAASTLLCSRSFPVALFVTSERVLAKQITIETGVHGGPRSACKRMQARPQPPTVVDPPRSQLAFAESQTQTSVPPAHLTADRATVSPLRHPLLAHRTPHLRLGPARAVLDVIVCSVRRCTAPPRSTRSLRAAA